MSNVNHREKFRRLDSQIWKKTKIDVKGRCVLPEKLRHKLGINGHNFVLWISAKRKEGSDNEFILEVGVKK
jgi:bifunctional DNA-binding transcriptional regulator/antitoxin component of YhaV-PrlF toxin-antitoxin module